MQELAVVDAKGKVVYKLATVEAQEDAYVPMNVYGFMNPFLIYDNAAKAPVVRTALINAPFVSMDRITFVGDEPVEYSKIAKMSGNFYFTDGILRNVADLYIDTDNNDDYGDSCDLGERFPTWDAAVAELNKITNADYGYKLELREDIGEAVIEDKTMTAGKVPQDFTVITAVPMAKLNLPVNVTDLTIAGNGRSFIFTSPAIAVNSNITFENVSFICLKKVTNKETRNNIAYSVPTYTATPITISVAAKRDVTFYG